MQTDNGLRAYYLDIYNELNNSVIIAKELVKNALPFGKDIETLIKEITEIRKEVDRIFSNPIFYQICNQCHKRSQDGCCKRRDSYLSWGDGVYIVSENVDFQLPKPDIKFLLSSFNNIPCLFLGSKNCLLKEKRPTICLREVCDDLHSGEQKLINNGFLFKKQMTNLLNGLDVKTGALFKHIWSKNKLCFFDNLANQKLVHLASCLKTKNPYQFGRDCLFLFKNSVFYVFADIFL